MSVFVIL